jgi:hypothetical protein
VRWGSWRVTPQFEVGPETRELLERLAGKVILQIEFGPKTRGDFENAEAGAGGPLGIVSVSRRNAEIRADPVPLIGLDGAAVLSSTAMLIIVTHSPTSAFTSSGASRSPSAVEPTIRRTAP